MYKHLHRRWWYDLSSGPLVQSDLNSVLCRPTQVPRGLAHIDPWDTLSTLVVRVNGLNPGMVSEQESLRQK